MYVTRVIPEQGIALLRKHAEVDINETERPLTQDDLRHKAAEYDALVTLLTDRIDRAVLDAGKGRLKIVANVAVGYDNIDVKAATDDGIMVSNTPGVLSESTADFTWALLMAAARRVCESQAFLRSGKFRGWGIMTLLGEDIHGKTLGIIGFGRIGQAVAQRAVGFNTRILYYDPVARGEEAAAHVGAEQVNLETLLRESDYITVHTPLTRETHHLIGAPQFEIMKPTAYLINTSRGPVIDEVALARALEAKEIKGAALDVFENEPEVYADLLKLGNVVLTPHVASASVATRDRMSALAAENVIAALEGKRPPALVNTEVLQRRP